MRAGNAVGEVGQVAGDTRTSISCHRQAIIASTAVVVRDARSTESDIAELMASIVENSETSFALIADTSGVIAVDAISDTAVEVADS